MDSIKQFITLNAFVANDQTVASAQDIFLGNPALQVLGVLQDGRAAGLVTREAVTAADAVQPIAGLIVADAPVFSPDLSPLQAASLLADSGRDGFLVCDGPDYVGCGSLRSLLSALARRNEAIAEAVRATEAAEQADRNSFKRVFLDTIGRELCGPIDGVLAMAELLERQPLGADAQSQVRAIREASDQLRRLVTNVSDFTRAEQGLLELRAERVLLRDILDEVQAHWQADNEHRGVTLLMSYDGDAEMAVVTDAPRLVQIFDSLIEPALANTRTGSVEVTLRATPAKEGVHVEGRVRDTSPGVPEQLLARIFEPDVGPGGAAVHLNLALARQLVQALNGMIRAESNAGVGLTMTFDFICPVAVAAAAAAEPSGVSRGAAHILIVDDNATNRMVAEALVEMFDCTSECAEDGVEAVEIARSGRFDVILMDIKMPRMDGMTATRAIRALPGEAGAAPIIALTANVDPEDARAYLASGMCAVVEKPIKPDRLLQAINEALASGTDRHSVAA
jgi:two-component system, sensor histidine kinase